MSSVIHVTPSTSASNSDGAGIGIDVNVTDCGKINYQPSVANAKPRRVMSSPTNGDCQTFLLAEADRGNDIGDIRTARDQRWLPVMHRVINLPSLGISGILRGNQLAA